MRQVARPVGCTGLPIPAYWPTSARGVGLHCLAASWQTSMSRVCVWEGFSQHCVCSAVVFTALHGMQTLSSDGNSVCPSVCPSVRLSNAWIVAKRKKNQSRFLYHTKDHLDYTMAGGNGGGDLFYQIFWANRPPLPLVQNRRF